jgi:holliday junction DNA helicase RuvA
MIGWMKGTILKKQPPHLLLDVQGVGYEIEASMTTFYALPSEGESVMLHTHLAIRDDAHHLYGFHEERERKLFRTLIKVNGVGAKLALTILSSMEPDGFVRSVTESDTASLVRLPGVGKKTAERLIVEMRDKLQSWETTFGTGSDADSAGVLAGSVGKVGNDAISALQALGYKAQDAKKVITRLLKPGLSTEDVVKQALQQL